MIFYRHLRRHIKLQGERSSSLDLARGRLVLISGVFFLAYMLLAVRAFDLTVIQGSAHDVTSDKSYLYSEAVDKQKLRADITDRNGTLLATTLQTASLYADPHFVSDPQEAAHGLVRIFPELSYGDVLQKLQSKKRFVWLRRNIMPVEQLDVLGLGEPGLSFEFEDRRVYPHGALLSHLVGYTNVDTLGQAGVERSFNTLLSDGDPLTLTIDIRLQHAMRREISRVMDEFKAIAGFGVIMDVRNGEVLAGVSLPDFDPHSPGKASDVQMFNRLTLGAYELGSVFKIFSTAALFETLDVPMGTTFDASEPIRAGRFTITDYHGKGRILSVPEVFMYSSNIGSAMMGQAVGSAALKAFYSDLGLLTRMDFEINEIAKPQVPEPWGEISTLTASYGHGIATTPLQMVSAVASIVNGGTLVKPTLVLDRGADPSSSTPKNNQDVRIVSPQTAHRMRQLLRLVVTDGTGRNADVPGYHVGGKTGTAEKVGAKGYDKNRLISSFVGVFPVDAPRYAVFIAIDEPKGHKASFGYATAGWTAAPAVRRVITSMASILGLQPQTISAEQDLGNALKHYIADTGKK